jgi:bacillaene synthase trans-acting acyltransferase
MSPPRTVFMFSGQGSQYFQMGRVLFDQEPVYRERLLSLDEVLRSLCGRSVVDALYLAGRGKADTFDELALTHPAIFMVEVALAELLIEKGVVPDLVLGCSLGSFAAAVVAGCITAEDALVAVVRQAEVVRAHCEEGGMIAVLGERSLLEEAFLPRDCDLAAENFATHFVVSANRPGLERIEAGLRERRVTFQRLPVRYAFHSRWIDPAQASLELLTQSLKPGPAKLPVVCCASAARLSSLHANYFWSVVRHPMRFREAIAALEDEEPCRYIDLSPSGTLATFLKYILPASSRYSAQAVMTPYGQETRHLAAIVGGAGSAAARDSARPS